LLKVVLSYSNIKTPNILGRSITYCWSGSAGVDSAKA
jgi:hypothetical protein